LNHVESSPILPETKFPEVSQGKKMKQEAKYERRCFTKPKGNEWS
jgi:hypothetical protein